MIGHALATVIFTAVVHASLMIILWLLNPGEEYFQLSIRGRRSTDQSVRNKQATSSSFASWQAGWGILVGELSLLCGYLR